MDKITKKKNRLKLKLSKIKTIISIWFLELRRSLHFFFPVLLATLHTSLVPFLTAMQRKLYLHPLLKTLKLSCLLPVVKFTNINKRASLHVSIPYASSFCFLAICYFSSTGYERAAKYRLTSPRLSDGNGKKERKM